MKAFLKVMMPVKLETGGGIRKKGDGTGVMVSAFLTEESGFASFSAEEFELSNFNVL